MSRPPFREIHTCPLCGCNHEISFPADRMQSIPCDECAADLDYRDLGQFQEPPYKHQVES